MTYSCAVFERPDEPLEAAQLRKLRNVCEKLGLGPDDRVLEIGCGWGSFAASRPASTGRTSRGSPSRRPRPRPARRRAAAAGLSSA